MNILIGIYPTQNAAEDAIHVLGAAGLTQENILMLSPHTPESSDETPDPASILREPDTYANLGHAAGGFVGFAGGLLGGAATILALPALGPVLAIGAIGLASALGTFAGSAAGAALEESMTERQVRKEFLPYQEALRQGHWLLVVRPNSDTQKEEAGRILAAGGAEASEITLSSDE